MSKRLAQQWYQLNLSTKLVVLSAVTMGLLVLMTAYIAVILFSAGLREGTDQLLKQDIDYIKDILFLDTDGKVEMFGIDVFNNPNVSELDRFRIQIRDAKGNTLLSSANYPESNTPSMNTASIQMAITDDIHIGGELLRTRSEKFLLENNNQTEEVVIQAVRSIEPLHKQEQRLIRLITWLAPIPILLMILGSILVARYTLRPLKQIMETVNRIDADELSARLPVGQEDELGHLARTVNTLLDRLEHAFDSLRRFTADASHELRTPLASLRAQGEVALGRERNPLEYRQTIGGILEEVVRLERLIDTLLHLARGDAGMIRPVWEQVDISRLVDSWIERYKILMEEKFIKLETDIETDIHTCADNTILERAIANLLDNAAKFTPTHGSVSITLKRNQDTIRLRVSNSGCAISEKEKERIFHRFVKLDHARSLADGFGLGLAIVQWAMDVHQGRVTVKVDGEKTNHFDLFLPTNKKQAA